MKMNKILYFGLLLLSVLSCAEIDSPLENVPAEPQCIIYADAPQTKTSLNSGDGKVNWVKGDQIFVGQRGVAVEKQGNLKMFTNTAESAPTATFGGVDLKFSADVVAIYPASAYQLETAEGSVVQIPTMQFAVKDNFPRTDIVSNQQSMVINPSFGFAKQAESTTSVHMGFKNLGGLIEFTIPDYLENINYVMIECLNEGAVISGNFMLKINDDGNISSFAPVTDPAFGSADNKTHVIVYPSDNSGVFSPGTYYAVVAPGNYTGLRVTLHTNIDGKFVKTASSLSFEIKKSQIFTLPTLVAAPAVGDYFLADGTWASSSRKETVDPADGKTKVEGKEVLGYIFSTTDKRKDEIMYEYHAFSAKTIWASLMNDTKHIKKFHGYVVSKHIDNNMWSGGMHDYCNSKGNNELKDKYDSYTYWAYEYTGSFGNRTGKTANFNLYRGYVNCKYWKSKKISLTGNISTEHPKNTSDWYVPSTGEIQTINLSLPNILSGQYWTSSISHKGTAYDAPICYRPDVPDFNYQALWTDKLNIIYMLVF